MFYFLLITCVHEHFQNIVMWKTAKYFFDYLMIFFFKLLRFMKDLYCLYQPSLPISIIAILVLKEISARYYFTLSGYLYLERLLDHFSIQSPDKNVVCYYYGSRIAFSFHGGVIVRRDLISIDLET